MHFSSKSIELKMQHLSALEIIQVYVIWLRC